MPARTSPLTFTHSATSRPIPCIYSYIYITIYIYIYIYTYVSLDGSSQWLGDAVMTTTLRDTNRRRVKSIAFGEPWESHFIVDDDGYWQQGKISLPGLSNIFLETRGN